MNKSSFSLDKLLEVIATVLIAAAILAFFYLIYIGFWLLYTR